MFYRTLQLFEGLKCCIFTVNPQTFLQKQHEHICLRAGPQLLAPLAAADCPGLALERWFDNT